MKIVTHQQQKEAWEKEHSVPSVLLQMDSSDPSSGILKFYQWLKDNTEINSLNGLEMGCGKGRNCIWLAEQGIEMTGFDFSPSAINEAKLRASKKNTKADFILQDATEPWNFRDNSFSFGIDCFASTDIESELTRIFAYNEFYRVIKPQGYLFIYTLSTQDQFHKEMIETSPSEENNSFIHHTGKFEKVFDENELDCLLK